MYAVAVLWGSRDHESLEKTKSDAVFETVASFHKAIREKLATPS